MKKFYPILFLLIAFVFLLLEKFTNNSVIAIIIIFVTVFLSFLKIFRKQYPSLNKSIEFLRRKIPFAYDFFDEINKNELAKDNNYLKYKKAILESNEKLIDNFKKDSKSSLSFINTEMEVEIDIVKSRLGHNNTDWKEIEGNHFILILGKSGSGKSYNLRSKFKYYNDYLKSKIENVNSEELQDSGNSLNITTKIPIFLELKSISHSLSRDWIKEQIITQIQKYDSNFRVKWEYLDLIFGDNEFIFFFDALDEVSNNYRDRVLHDIVALSKDYSVLFSCRSHVYEELQYKRDNYSENKGHELVPPYLEPKILELKPLKLETVEKIIDNHDFKRLKNQYKFIAESPSDFSDKVDCLKIELKSFIHACSEEIKNQIKTPIFLNLLISVFPKLKHEEKVKLQSNKENENLNLLWSIYEKNENDLLQDDSIKSKELNIYTIWIAKIVGTSSFSAESIQPNWLKVVTRSGEIHDSKWLQKLYFLITRIVAAIIIGVGFGCIISTPFTFISNSILGGILIAIIAGVYKYHIRPKQKKFYNFLFAFLLFFFSVLGCGLFQALSVPRYTDEMTTNFLSIPESYSGILLGMVLSSIFSYRIIKEYKSNLYILSVDRFHFNWNKALQNGVLVGTITGIVVGSIAVLVKNQQTNSLFYNGWLMPHIENIVDLIFKKQLNQEQLDIVLFFYAFVVMLVVSTFIITILVGPYNDRDIKHTIDRQNLNFNIRKSILKSLYNALQIGIFVFLIYSILFILIEQNLDGIFFAIKISVGFFILGFYWYGGMEVINFAILRIKLYILGIVPYSYKLWRDKYLKLGLITESGKEMKFFHDSVAHYYINYKPNKIINLSDNYNPAGLQKFIFPLILIFAMIMLTPFFSRYYFNIYWQTSNEIQLDSKYLALVDSNNVYECKSGGILKFKVTGSIHVGTFVGRVLPHGTNYGFMGMKIDSAYNVAGFGKYKHAALLFRKKKRNQYTWSNYEYMTSSLIDNEIEFLVEKGDLFEFIVNDKEWQNNISRYNISAIIE